MSNLIKRLPLPIWASLILYRVLNVYRLLANKNGIESDISKQIEVFCPTIVGGGQKKVNCRCKT